MDGNITDDISFVILPRITLERDLIIYNLCIVMH